MIPKFKIGDKVKSTFFKDAFTVYKIQITASEIIYEDNEGNHSVQDDLTLYTEPKPKVKKYLWAYRCNSVIDNEQMTRIFYKSEQDFLLNNSVDWCQRIDWSMIECEE